MNIDLIIDMIGDSEPADAIKDMAGVFHALYLKTSERRYMEARDGLWLVGSYPEELKDARIQRGSIG